MSHMGSVGALMFNGQIVGTAFRVGDTYLMTAWHVVNWILGKF